MSYQDVLQEPAEEFGRATLIWSLDAAHDKLEAERQNKGPS